jgi:hypothetical protein
MNQNPLLENYVYNIDLTNPNNTNVQIYKYDRVFINITPSINVIWTPINKSQYLPSQCYPVFMLSSINYIFERDIDYEIQGEDELGNVYTKTIRIQLLEKPMNILDIDLIPIDLFEPVINQNKKRIIEILKNNRTLLNQLIQFYNIQLMSSYKFEFQAKQGRGFKVPWYSRYNVVNDNNIFLLSFQQQYQFLRYLLNNNNRWGKSYFMYLINIIQFNFVLPSCSNFNN